MKRYTQAMTTNNSCGTFDGNSSPDLLASTLPQPNYRSPVLLHWLCFLALVICWPPQTALAQWNGGVEGGTVFRDGGTATRLRLKADKNVRPLSHFIYADWIRADGGENIYEIGYRPRYWFTNKFYSFGEGSIRVDRPLLIDSQTLIVGGIGYSLFSSPDKSLFVEAGLGARRTEFLESDGLATGLSGSDTNDTLSLLRASYRQILSDLLRLEFDLDFFDGDSLRQTVAEAGISARIPGGAIKYSYRIRRVDPDDGASVEDDDSFVSFTYGF